MNKPRRFRQAAFLAALAAVLLGMLIGCTDLPAELPSASGPLPSLLPVTADPADDLAPAAVLPELGRGERYEGFLFNTQYTGVSEQEMDDYLGELENAGYQVLQGTGYWFTFWENSRLVFNEREIQFFSPSSVKSGVWYMKQLLPGRQNVAALQELQAMLPDDEVLCALDLTTEEVYRQTGLRRLLCVTAGFGPGNRSLSLLSAVRSPDFSICSVLVGANGLLVEDLLSETNLDAQLSADLDGDGTAELLTMAYERVTDVPGVFTVRAYGEDGGYPVIIASTTFWINDWSVPFPTLGLRDGSVCLDDVPIVLEGIQFKLGPSADRETVDFAPGTRMVPEIGMSFAGLREAMADKLVYSTTDCMIFDLSETHHPAPFLVAAISGNGVSVTGLAESRGGTVYAFSAPFPVQPPGNLSALLSCSSAELTEQLGEPHFHGEGEQLCWITQNGLLLRVSLEEHSDGPGEAVYADLYNPADGAISVQAWAEGYSPAE